MIARMEKLFMVGSRKIVSNLLFNLQRAGVVQIERLPEGEFGEYRLDPAEEMELKRWDSVATSADHALRLLGLESDVSVELYNGELEAAERMVSICEERAATLVERLEELKEERELVGQYRRVVELLAAMVQDLDASTRLTVLPFLLEKPEVGVSLERQLKSNLGERYAFAAESTDGLTAAVIVTLKRDAENARVALSRHGLGELPRPGKYAQMSLNTMASELLDRSGQVPQEIAAVNDDLKGLCEEAGRNLKSIWNRAKDESARLHALRELASGRYGFALFGWVPVSLKSKIHEMMRPYGDEVLCAFEPVDVGHEVEQVPVMLENPPWVKPFESLISFLNTPRYDAWDPTWIIAVLFPLWFGMIVGDIGYGLIFAVVAWYFWTRVRQQRALRVDFFKLRLSPRAVEQLVWIMLPMIGWTLVWGFIYGECFGDLLQRLGFFGTTGRPGLIPVLIPRTETASTANLLILVSVGFGVFQVLHGFYIKALFTSRHGEAVHFWEACGYLGGVSGLVLFAYAFMSGGFPLWLLIPMCVGAGVFLIGMIRARMPLMIAELPTQGGHILSYIRIYAVGLASAILANLTTDMGFSLYHLVGVAGLVVALLVGLLMGLVVHSLLLVLLTVSHVLQPIRLIWVEFFTKFDFYTLSGKTYRPFKSVRGSS